jgi:hypothetical protein
VSAELAIFELAALDSIIKTGASMLGRYFARGRPHVLMVVSVDGVWHLINCVCVWNCRFASVVLCRLAGWP